MISSVRNSQTILVTIGDVQVRFPNTPKTEETITRLEKSMKVMQEDVLKKGVEKGIGIGLEISNAMNAMFGRAADDVEAQKEPEPKTTGIMPFNLHEQLSNIKLASLEGNVALYSIFDTNNTMIGVLEFNPDAEQAFSVKISIGMGNEPINFGFDVNPEDIDTLVASLQNIGIKSVKAL